MREIGFGRQLRGGSKLLGAWCTFSSFAAVEVMTELGFDFLVLDLQHCELTLADFPGILGAFRGARPAPVVRIPEVGYHTINWLLDQGVQAILAPMVNSAEAARKAVEAAKFPPLGKRSFGPYRAARYSFGIQEYMPAADDLATLIVQIESVDGVRQADEIIAVAGVDAIFVGPNDLAFSMLRPGQSLTAASSAQEGAAQWTGFARTPEVLALCEQVLSRCLAAGVPFGMTSSSVEEARRWLEKGAAFVTCGSDFLFIRNGAKQMLAAPETAKA